MRVESSRSQCCCPRALESLVSPRALESFNQWHILLQSENVFELGGITIIIKCSSMVGNNNPYNSKINVLLQEDKEGVLC